MSSALANDKDESGTIGADELAPGTQLLHGQYTIESFLNAGGFGITYLAKDSLERKVVIKECFPGSFCRRSRMIVQARSRAHEQELKSIVRLFVQEARSLAKLVHPNIVGVHQVFEDNDTAYMALDFIEGRDLLDIVEDANHGLQPDQIKMILRSMLGAVGFIHDQGMLHRDISPDNILLDGNQKPVLIDFGAAREEATKKSRVLSAMRVVKDGYSPQEFYISGSEQSACSDLYALGATFFHLITGEAPPNSQARLAAIASGETDPYTPLTTSFDGDGYERNVLHAIDLSLAVMPKDRVQSAQEWLDIMDGVAGAGANVTALRPSAAKSTTAPAASAEMAKPKSKMGLLLASVAAAALIGVGVVTSGMLSDPAAPAVEVATQIAPAAIEATADVSPAEVAETTDVNTPVAVETQIADVAQTLPAPKEPIAVAQSANTPGPVAPTPAPAETVVAEANPAPVFVAPTFFEPSETDVAEAVSSPLPTPRPVVEVEPATIVAAVEPEAPEFIAERAPVAPETREELLASNKVEPAAPTPQEPALIVEDIAIALPDASEIVAPDAPVEPEQLAVLSTPLAQTPQEDQNTDPVVAPTNIADIAETTFATMEAIEAIVPGVEVIARAPEVVEEVQPIQTAASVEADWFVEMPFKGTINAPTTIDEIALVAPVWVERGMEVTTVNAEPVTDISEIDDIVLASFNQDAGEYVAVKFGTKTPDGEVFEHEAKFPVVFKTKLSNGMSFHSTRSGDTWETYVATLPANGGGDLRVGDQIMAYIPTSEVLTEPASLQSIMARELAEGISQFSFAVSRDGEMWVASLNSTNEPEG